MQKGTVRHTGFEFDFDAEGDPYGEAMWEGLLAGGYESTTLGFMLSHLSSKTLLVDVGAASGVFSLLAASLGSKVIAIEADPNWFRLLEKNVRLNKFTEVVNLQEVAVSGQRVLAEPSQRVRGQVLHHSVMSDQALKSTPPKLDSLRRIIEVQGQGGKQLVVKIDIEGAEFAILKDSVEADYLISNRAILFVSFHPGFHYNRVSTNNLVWLLNAIYSRFRGLVDCATVFTKLQGHKSCQLPNGRRVKRKLDFLALTFFGAHDFVFDFAKDK